MRRPKVTPSKKKKKKNPSTAKPAGGGVTRGGLVRKTEFRPSATFERRSSFSPAKVGWLDKKARSLGGYQRRYFVASGHYLRYFADEACSELLAAIDVTGARLERLGSRSVSLTRAGHRFAFRCASPLERDDWLRCLEIMRDRADAASAPPPQRPDDDSDDDDVPEAPRASDEQEDDAGAAAQTRDEDEDAPGTATVPHASTSSTAPVVHPQDEEDKEDAKLRGGGEPRDPPPNAANEEEPPPQGGDNTKPRPFVVYGVSGGVALSDRAPPASSSDDAASQQSQVLRESMVAAPRDSAPAAASGTLLKRSGIAEGTWRSRFFVACGHYLRYYRSDAVGAPLLGAVDLEAAVVDDAKEADFAITVRDGRALRFRADDADAARQWVATLREMQHLLALAKATDAAAAAGGSPPTPKENAAGDDETQGPPSPFMPKDDDDDDEEEDGGDGEGGAEEPADGAGVVLKGAVRVEEGRLWWQGLWASSEATYAQGATSKFKYGGPSGVDDAALDAPPAGAWNGYFMNPDSTSAEAAPATEDGAAAPTTKVREKGVTLTFEPTADATLFVVSGDGANDFGDFRITGTYDASSRQLDCVKTYDGAAEDDDDDDDDDLDADAVDDDYEDELAGLKEEQDMPIDELAKRYGADPPPAKRAKT